MISQDKNVKVAKMTSSSDANENAGKSLLLTAAELAGQLRISSRQVRRLDLEGKIPRPLVISPRVVRWRHAEIVEWLAAGAPDRVSWESMTKLYGA